MSSTSYLVVDNSSMVLRAGPLDYTAATILAKDLANKEQGTSFSLYKKMDSYKVIPTLVKE